MLAKWLQILPVFIYKRIAKKYCGTMGITGKLIVYKAAKDILIVKES